MTALPTAVPAPAARLDFHALAGGFHKAMLALDRAATSRLDEAGVDRRLRELVRVRASQINGCAFCIDMHTKDARAAGESEQRLHALPAWRETGFFTAPERAALALTEAITRLAETHVADEVYDAASAELGDDATAAVIALIVTINAWNALGVSTRAWEPGSYQPRTPAEG